jgi:phosphatidate cytidylyltransferase
MVSSGPWSGLAQRAGTAILLATVSLGLIWWGGGPFMFEVVLFALAGSCEFFDLVERKHLRPLRRSGTLFTMLLLLVAWYYGLARLAHLTLFSLLALLVLCVLRSHTRKSVLLDGAATWLGVMYIGWLFSFLVLIRDLPQGAAWVTVLITMCAATDVGGYFVGRSLGRNKLWEALSPKKTIEGSLGGLLGAGLVGILASRWLGIPAEHGLALGAGVSLIGQLGDLWESALKREVGVKDAGRLLGGHGGVLDRFDSLAFAAPFFYLYLNYLLPLGMK